ncbi:hypothetical protein IP92_04738 [Pseudoduganella flava]|uniref:Pirin family protein n=1 Tax=Pseudoduganella flava TaxID=871742 RepID=A0A562PGV0_9BURK|nr:pirin family protein [Pseudoduganella flava]QGZ42534.1 pirin family protein [Pseudoduganella flava]TWI43685.1 hypothetical protein IP92_04738 [Pseudoduganella flava]
MNADTVTRSRTVERVIQGQAVMDGAGVKINRVLTQPLQRRLDPFLMLDNFGSEEASDYLAGFPDHPHRGFETVTYMLEGRMRHRDSAGNEGLLENGGVQWMTAGRGVIHSEMPEQEEGLMEGFQLWLNLPAKDKLMKPWYKDFKAAEIPSFTTVDGATVRVIAGSSHGVAGAVQRDVTQPIYIDVELPAGAVFTQALPAGHNAFLYPYRGSVTVAGKAVQERSMAILANDKEADGVEVRTEAPARFILIAGQPLNEPIAQYGPFVMNTQEEIHQAVQDFRAGLLGEEAHA